MGCAAARRCQEVTFEFTFTCKKEQLRFRRQEEDRLIDSAQRRLSCNAVQQPYLVLHLHTKLLGSGQVRQLLQTGSRPHLHIGHIQRSIRRAPKHQTTHQLPQQSRQTTQPSPHHLAFFIFPLSRTAPLLIIFFLFSQLHRNLPSNVSISFLGSSINTFCGAERCPCAARW